MCSVRRLGLIRTEEEEGERPSTRSRDYLHPRRQIIDSNCGSARLEIGSTDRSARGGKREIMMRLGRNRSHIIFSRYDSGPCLLLYARARLVMGPPIENRRDPGRFLGTTILGIAGRISTMTPDPSAGDRPSSFSPTRV